VSASRTIRERFLDVAHRHGILLRPCGGRLHVKGPSAVLTPELMDWLQANKAAVLAILEAPTCIEAWPPVDAVDPQTCLTCGGLHAWQSMAGRWRCSRCDPPVTAERLLALRERILKWTRKNQS
jgi:hypothetical protein